MARERPRRSAKGPRTHLPPRTALPQRIGPIWSHILAYIYIYIWARMWPRRYIWYIGCICGPIWTHIGYIYIYIWAPYVAIWAHMDPYIGICMATDVVHVLNTNQVLTCTENKPKLCRCRTLTENCTCTEIQSWYIYQKQQNNGHAPKAKQMRACTKKLKTRTGIENSMYWYMHRKQ
jgi:hypothetical protein